ncbi:hypothetical protein [Streptomyces sp. 7N604]|uniref:hypothetical protein n=1 Tax=Streptomyces sp. 7N604 TaxID=3457415 RepID=UPI003FD11E5A
MPNAELAARILREITERPDHYDQTHWLDGVDILLPAEDLTGGVLSCGTTLCVAGFAAHLTGHTIAVEFDDEDECVVASKPGRPATLVNTAARAELALTESDAAWLFWGTRTPAQVHAALGQLAAGADTIDRASIDADPLPAP